MFEREHHRRIATILEALDPACLAASSCYFGGGTAMALRYGEYRESVDIDFLVSNVQGYRQLRQQLTRAEGLQAITRAGHALNQVREMRADQYGIRTMLRVDNTDIKFEIVLEARMVLETPGAEDHICGVATLTALDMVTSKLLANSDRWRDDAVLSRDLIDLAMMSPPIALLREAVVKAEAAYGQSILRDLKKSIDALQGRPGRLERCMQVMAMSLPKAVLWQKIRALRRVPPK